MIRYAPLPVRCCCLITINLRSIPELRPGIGTVIAATADLLPICGRKTEELDLAHKHKFRERKLAVP
jgi:hypothetical protein